MQIFIILEIKHVWYTTTSGKNIRISSYDSVFATFWKLTSLYIYSCCIPCNQARSCLTTWVPQHNLIDADPIRLHGSYKFHIAFTSTPAEAVCKGWRIGLNTYTCKLQTFKCAQHVLEARWKRKQKYTYKWSKLLCRWKDVTDFINGCIFLFIFLFARFFSVARFKAGLSSPIEFQVSKRRQNIIRIFLTCEIYRKITGPRHNNNIQKVTLYCKLILQLFYKWHLKNFFLLEYECWFLIREFLWQSPGSKLTVTVQSYYSV